VRADTTTTTVSRLAGERTVVFGFLFLAIAAMIAAAGLVWVAQIGELHVGVGLLLFAVFLAFVGISAVRAGLWYGRATLALASALPLRLGDVIEGHVDIARGIHETLDVSLLLELTRRDHPRSRMEPRRERHVTAQSVGRGDASGRARIPIRLELPADAEPSSSPGVLPIRKWTLHVEASPRGGPALRTSFVLPVVR
jgi:hypothetical protein